MKKNTLKSVFSSLTALHCLIAGYAVVLIITFVRKCLKQDIDYTSWHISDWMINYQGGFVRRGLTGELLLQLYGVFHIPPREVIMIVAGAAFVALIWLLVRLFNKEGWSHMLLFAPCLLAMTVPMRGWFWTRRDNLALLMTWAIFLFFSRYIRKHDLRAMAAMQLLSVMTLLIHEASFLFTFPLLFLLAYGHFAQTSAGTSRPMAKAVLTLLPAMAAMAAVCLAKGDAATVQAVWDSWMPAMQEFPLGESHATTGMGVEALAWDTLPTFEFHFRRNWMKTSDAGIPLFPLRLLKFAAFYYLVTRIDTVDLKWNTLKPVDRIAMSNILLAQLCFLLPLFTVLSCDMDRIYGYWVFSTLMAYHYFKNDRMAFGGGLQNVSCRLQHRMDKIKLLSNPYVYVVVMFCL